MLEATGAEPWGASAITLAEVLVAPARAGRLKEAKRALDRLGVIELDLGADSPHRLAGLRAETACKLPDCCVLAAALEHDGTVASFDAGLISAARRLELKTLE